MMKNNLFIVILCVFCASCGPRIEMDMAQWGDHAYIDNVEVVKLETDDHVKLEEYYNSQAPLESTGVRNIIISTGKAVIDSVNFIATVIVNQNENLKYAGIKITHKAVKIEPMGDTPKAGIVTDLTNGNLRYKVKSADGSQHDWTIILKQ